MNLRGAKFKWSVLLVGMIIMACDNGDFKDTGEKEKKVVAQNLPVSQNNQEAQDVPIANTRYDVKVNAGTGMELCTGTMQMQLSTSFRLNPTGQLKCVLLGDLDLAQLFGSPPIGEEQNVDMSQFPQFGRISRAPNPVTLGPGLAQWNPPKPSFLGPVIQDPNAYAGLVYREASRVQGVSRAGQPFQAQGEWFFQVHEVNASHRPITYQGPMQFNSIIRWELKSAGFESAPSKPELFAFDSVIFYWNTDPIAVPEITIEGKLAELAPGALSSIGDLLLSGVVINIRLLEHTPL